LGGLRHIIVHYIEIGGHHCVKTCTEMFILKSLLLKEIFSVFISLNWQSVTQSINFNHHVARF